MKIIRYYTPTEGIRYGWLLEDMVGPLEGDPFSDFRRLEVTQPVSSIKLLPPVLPSKIICVGRNYVAHAKEHGAEVPELPLIFLKPPTTIIASGERIILPPQSNQVEHEAELAIVIGKTGRWIKTEEASQYIFGYTIANDVTARDLQFKDGQWTRAKGFDTFCPIGPTINTDFDPTDAMITCHVNGELRQMASTQDMVFNARQLVAYASSIMTLHPGDLILTGTPAGVGILRHGDMISIAIDGIGILQNPAVAEAV
jgi:2-keto-4-pentenoate hydratase/2-oxohepta-3-ene-1,7-dioic acid hydratase in catechol pathway